MPLVAVLYFDGAQRPRPCVLGVAGADGLEHCTAPRLAEKQKLELQKQLRVF